MIRIPYGKQVISPSDIESVVDALRSPYLTQGPAVPQFESSVCSAVKSRYGVATNSATSALHIACLALGLGDGDRLWTSPTTFVASANCGLYCGAHVEFVDIDITTGLMSVRCLEQKLRMAKANGTLPKIVIPVHLCGASCDMQAIAGLAKKYKFNIIEDASHAIGATYQGEPVGDCRYSDITVFSFHPVKIVTTGEGGMATTNSAEFAQAMRDLRSHGVIKEAHRLESEDPAPWSYEQQSLGFNYRMTDLQAALGTSQLKQLPVFVEKRRKLFHNYLALTQDLPGQFLDVPSTTESSHHLAVYLLSDTSPRKHRRLFSRMREDGIGVQVHYAPVHLQPYYRKRFGYQEGDFPAAEEYASRAITLPLHPGLTSSQMNEVTNSLQRGIENGYS